MCGVRVRKAAEGMAWWQHSVPLCAQQRAQAAAPRRSSSAGGRWPYVHGGARSFDTEPSRVVPHRSTTSARPSLTSLFGWEAVTLGGMAEWGVRGAPGEGWRLPQIFRTKAESQRIVATRPLCRVQYPVPYSSRLQGIHRPGSGNCDRARLRWYYPCS